MADVTLMKTPAETALAQAFESARTTLPGNVESRAQAFEGKTVKVTGKLDADSKMIHVDSIQALAS